MVDGLRELHLERYRVSGAELIMGEACFVGDRTVEVELGDGGRRRMRGDRVFLNLGTHATVPDVPGLAAVINRDLAARLSQPPGDAETDDPGADDNGLRTVRWNNERRANDGLPSPGMPGQVQWV